MIKRFIPERTPEELERRLQLLKHRKARSAAWHNLPQRRWIIVGALIVGVVGAALVIADRHVTDSSPINLALAKQAGFPLYEPKSMPIGLVYGSGSPKVSQGIVSYSLHCIAGIVTISEQAVPPTLPDFSNMGLTSSQVPAGVAYSGLSNGRSIALVASTTTFISISADSNVPNTVVTQVAKSLTALPQ